MVDYVRRKLIEAGYNRIGADCPDVSLYYYAVSGECCIVNLVDYRNPKESMLNTDMLVSLNNSVVVFMRNKGFENVRLITVIATYSEYIAEELAGGRMQYWVLDVYHNLFIIPEGQPAAFGNLEKNLQHIAASLNFDLVNVPRKKAKKQVKLFTVNNLLVLINVFIFIILESLGSTEDMYFMLEHGAFFWPSIKIHGEFYRFFTCIFIHFGFSHLAGNMIILFFLGDNLERAVGKIKYIMIYLMTGLAASGVSCVYYLVIDEYVVSGGASGAIFGVVGALVYIVSVNRGKLEDLSSFKLILFVAFSFYSGFTSTGVDNAAHVGGFLAGLIAGKILYKTPPKYNIESNYKMY